MEEVRQLVQEEGREARNLVAFHVAIDSPNRVSRKPPRATAPCRVVQRRTNGPRLRSASTGRDKRSELRARYWALLFGDLQRAIGEIYNTVEAQENLNECQEVILVLENYTRDFKALCDWFRLKWEYDHTPPPQRPQSLAWEIRKTDFIRPESRRTCSIKSSPTASGKNSPSISGRNTPSGKNSPNLTGKASPSGKISPRAHAGHPNISQKTNTEFFTNKIASSKIPEAPEPANAKLSDIKEKIFNESQMQSDISKELEVIQENEKVECTDIISSPVLETGTAKILHNVSPQPVIVKSPQSKQTSVKVKAITEPCYHAKAIKTKLDEMENKFLAKQIQESVVKNDNMLNEDKESDLILTQKKECDKSENVSSLIDKERDTTKSPTASEENFADISNGSSSKSVEEKTDIEIKVVLPSDSNIVDENSSSEKLVKGELSNNQPDVELDDLKTDKEELVTPAEIQQVNLQAEISHKDDTKKDLEQKKAEIKSGLEIKPSKPAYSQAAAKPKPAAAMANKPDSKPTSRSTTPLPRSKTIIEIRPNVPKAPRQYPRKNQANKCSYPFNLTTGRTSLFDTSSNNASKPLASRKPSVKNVQMASGDAKANTNKVDVKKRLQRPMSLKINEGGDKKEKCDVKRDKIQDSENYGSCDTIVGEIDVSRIESNESLITLVPDDLQMLNDVANSIEVLNVDSKNDNEGWLTVKSRRVSRESKKQFKSHWANRFHQPSATTSLPTLNMMESPKQEIQPIVDSSINPKIERAKSEQPQHVEKPKKSEIEVKAPPTPEKIQKPTKDTAIIRQKSDVTGLRTKSSRHKAISRRLEKARKHEENELIKSRLHSSLESLTTGLARSQENTEDTFDFDKWKAEFKTTFKYLDDDEQIPNHNEILQVADPSEASEIAEMTSQIEESERELGWALDFQSDVDQKKLCEEEDLLNRQIMELQQVSDIDMDTETDDTETDAEIINEDIPDPGPSCSPESLSSITASLEDQYEMALAGMSWAERMDTLVALEALVARDPGRAQQLHAKLSQGIKRRGSFQDALRRLQAKQARAERQRLEYQTERAKKIHLLLARVEEVKVAKNQLIDEKRLRMEKRLQKAAENRDQHLKDIVRKAHDEEEKLREIAFIKQLEAENRRHDFLDQCRSHTTRLRQMRRDRLQKLEQKAAREAAVGARRQALEEARRLHVETLLEKKKERDARVDQLNQQKKQERDDAAREKAEGVKSRLSALAAAAELEAHALRSRIRDKQDASQQRLESHLQAIREKATGPRQTTTSESHDQGVKEIEEEAVRIEQERKEREKQKAIKKKARKVKQKLLAASNDRVHFDDPPFILDLFLNPLSNKMSKAINQISNIIAPLIVTENNNSTEYTIQDETEKMNKKNKKKGEIERVDSNEGKKKKKKRLSESENNEFANDCVAVAKSDGKKKKKKHDNDKIIKQNDNNAKNDKSTDKNNDKVSNGNRNNSNINMIDKSNVIIENNIEKAIDKSEKNGKGDKNIDKSDNNSDKNDNNCYKSDKNNEKSEKIRRKLSKTSSLSSSLSDMSKGSSRVERKTRIVIDTLLLERQLNELHRIVERYDKQTSPEKVLFQKLNGLHILAQLIGAVAEKEDATSLFNPKILTTALCVWCAAGGSRRLAGSVPVHAITLLRAQLDKDLKLDSKELELTKQLCDSLSVTLDTALCSTRLYDDMKNKTPEHLSNLGLIRSRAHSMISYLCLSGCIAKAEKCEEARESIQTLLTVCADLCHPHEADVGSERASAVQSLRCALGTSVCGCRAQFCGLFARGAELAECGGFVRAARTTHLLKAVAELDYTIVQEAFGEGGWPLEFRAAVSRLLSQHAPNDKEAPRTTALHLSNQRLDQTLSEAMVLDLIVLVGFVIVNNPQLQETICSGWSVIKTLCTLPANWLVSRSHSPALLPTLVALCDSPANAAAIAGELSMKMLDDYMSSPEAQKLKLVQVIKQGRKKTSGKK